MPTVSLTNATTVTAANGVSGFTNVAYYTVLEFNSNILNSSTQQGTVSFTSTNNTATATITSVTTSQTMIVWGGYTAASANTSLNFYPWLTLTNGTTVTGTRTTTGSSLSASVNFSIIEFKTSDIKSLNRGSIVIANSTASNTATITAVDTTKTIANWLGTTNSAASQTNYAAGMTTLALTNSTTLTGTRGTASSATQQTVGYEAIEFNSAKGNMMLCL